MVRKLVVAVAVATAVVAFFALGLHQYLDLAVLKENRERLVALRERHEVAAAAAFFIIYVVQTALSLPGAAIMSLAAGAVFGTLAGTFYAVVSASVGATAACLISRYLLRDAVQRKFGSRIGRLNHELEREGLSYLLFLRLVPVFPFFLINVAAGLTRISLPVFFWGTVVGIIPGAFAYVNAGASLATVTRPADVASPRVLGSLALLGAFALVPVAWRKMKSRGSRAA